MNNGDHITGEIKKLQFGIVTFKTDDAGTLSIQWDKLRHLISTDIFEVDLADGRIYYGTLDTTYSVRQMVVKGKDETEISIQKVCGKNCTHQRNFLGYFRWICKIRF